MIPASVQQWPLIVPAGPCHVVYLANLGPWPWAPTKSLPLSPILRTCRSPQVQPTFNFLLPANPQTIQILEHAVDGDRLICCRPGTDQPAPESYSGSSVGSVNCRSGDSCNLAWCNVQTSPKWNHPKGQQQQAQVSHRQLEVGPPPWQRLSALPHAFPRLHLPSRTPWLLRQT